MNMHKRIKTGHLITSFGLGIVVALASVLSTPANGQVVVYDTGFSEAVLFNGTASNLGWTSGNNGAAGQPQRWAAQPFSLADDTLVTQINAEYFLATGTVTDIGIMIWNRTGELAPTTADEVFSTTVAEPGTNGNDIWSELSLGSGVSLAAGDYYLSVFGMDSSGADATIGWFTGAPNGVQFVDAQGPWMWRASMYPSPGFGFYQLPLSTLAANPGSDPNATYSAAFQIITVPEPGSISLLMLAAAGLFIRRRR